MQSIDSLKDTKGHIAKEGILKVLPYGKEFLFLDEVISLAKKKIIARKKVSGKEEYMNAHFTSFALMPGALILESIGQAAAVLIRYGIESHKEKHVVVYKIKEARFYSPVLPNQEMVIEAVSHASHNNKVLVLGSAKVNGKTVADVALILAIVDKGEFERKHS